MRHTLLLLSALTLAACGPESGDFVDGEPTAAAGMEQSVTGGEALAALADAGTPDAGVLPPVRTTHPHVFLSEERLAMLRASFPKPVFPANGVLQFTLTPRFASPLAPPEGSALPPFFDGYANDRSSIFIRHVPSWDQPAASPPTVGFQVGLQADYRQPRYAELASGHYVAGGRIDVPANVATVVRITWNGTTTHTASLQVGSGPVVALNWFRLSSGAYVDWAPDGQRFEFRGRDNEAVSQLSITDSVLKTTVSYPGVDLNLHRAWNNLRGDADSYAARLYDQCTVKTDPSTCGSPVVLTGATPTHPGHVQSVAEVLAMAAMRTGEVRYREAAFNYASKLLEVPYLEGGEYPMRGRIAAMGVLYDWMFEVMSKTTVRGSQSGVRYTQRLAEAIIGTIAAENAAGDHPFGLYICGDQSIVSSTTAIKCQEKPIMVGYDPAVHGGKPSIARYYLSGHHRGNVTAVVLALTAIASEYPGVLPMLQLAYEHFEVGFNPVRNYVSSEGGHQMGWYYGVSNSEAMEVFRNGFQWPSPPPVPTYVPRQFLFWLYGLRSTPVVSFPKAGDVFANEWDESTAVAALHASHHGTADLGPIAQWLYDDYMLPRRRGGGLWDLLLWRPGKARKAPGLMPLSRNFGPTGHVLMRDSWQFAPTTTLLEFHSAAFTSSNHQHLDQNSLSLFYKAPLLVDSGYYDSYGSPHWRNYYTRSVAHNTMTVFDPNERFMLGTDTLANDGGQWFFDGKAHYPTHEEIRPGGVNSLAGIVRYEHGTDFTFSVGDASRAYARAKLPATNGYLRHVLFLRQPRVWSKPVTLVYDSVQVMPGKESLRKRVLWHSVNEPTVNNQSSPGLGVWPIPVTAGVPLITRVRNGGGLAFLQTLLPVAPSLCKVGGGRPDGSGFRFAVASAIDCNAAVFTDHRPTTDEATMAKDPDVGAWRLEVIDTQGKDLAQFLHVISVADDGTAAPPAARRLTADPGTEAVLVGDALIAVFRQRGLQDRTHGFRVEEPNRRQMIVTGLVPNELYALNVSPVINTALSQVTLQPSATGTYRASSQGVVTVAPR
jgi:hypothetical protein